MKRKIRRVLCGLLTGFLVVTAIPAVVPENAYVKEVQAASRIGSPKLVSAKASGKKKIVVTWKQVKGVAGYTIYRKSAGSSWKALRTVNGAEKVSYSDQKVTTGEKYSYTVRAYKNIKNSRQWSAYNKKGVTAIAGIDTLRLNKTKVNVAVGKTYTLKIKGTKLIPKWKSGNKSVATVSKDGKITAKKAGTAKITAKLGEKSFTCTVTVTKVSAAYSKYAKNYAKVKNYINKHGKTDSDGNKYIEKKIDSNSTAIIGYDKKSDKIDIALAMINKKEDVASAGDVFVNCSKSGTAVVTTGMFGDGKEIYATAKFSAASYTGKKKITFQNISGGVASKKIQEASNAILQAAMAGADYILTTKLHMTVKDLGFTSYK